MNKRLKNSARSLGIIIISIFGFLVIITFFTDRNKMVVASDEMLKRMSTDYTLDSTQLASLTDYVLVNIRERTEVWEITDETEEVIISLPKLLSDDYKSMWRSDRAKVIKAQSEITAHQSWSLLTQMGYQNLYVYEN